MGTPHGPRSVAADLWDGCDAAVSSRLAYPEVRAALAASERGRRITPSVLRQAEVAWDGYWAAARAVELSSAVAQHAGDLAGRHALRGADTVHLASLLALGAPDVLFAGWDQRLRAVAAAAGARVVPA